MEKYRTVPEVMGIDAGKLNVLSDFFRRTNQIHLDTLNVINNVLDKGFLNPGENAYYYGVGATAAMIQQSIDIADTLEVLDDDLKRFDLEGKDWFYDKNTLSYDSGIVDIYVRPFNTYSGTGYKKNLILLSDGDADLNHVYSFVRVEPDKWLANDLISSNIHQAIKSFYGSIDAAKNKVYLLSHLDITQFMFALLGTMSHRGETSDILLEITASPVWRRIAGLQIPYWTWNALESPNPNLTFNKDDPHLGLSTEYTDYANLLLMYDFINNRSGKVYFEPTGPNSRVKAMPNDLWMQAWLLKQALLQHNIPEVAKMLEFINNMCSDFVQAAFDSNSSDADMKNWIYNYIHLNLQNSLCKTNLLNGSTKLPILDSFSSL